MGVPGHHLISSSEPRRSSKNCITCSPQWPLRPPKSQRSFSGCVRVCLCVLLLLFNPCQSLFYYLNELVKDFTKPSAHLSG